MTTVRYRNLARAVFVVTRWLVSTRLRYFLLCKGILRWLVSTRLRYFLLCKGIFPRSLKLPPCQP